MFLAIAPKVSVSVIQALLLYEHRMLLSTYEFLSNNYPIINTFCIFGKRICW